MTAVRVAATPSRRALVRAAEVLNLDAEDLRCPAGYLDLVAGRGPPPTGVAQLLMATRAVPVVYERWWRPTLARLVKGPAGPSMAQEQHLARELLALERGATVVDVACGPGNFTRRFATDVGERGTVIGIDLSVPMLTRAVSNTAATQVVYVRADVTDLSIRPGSVEAVCCFAALHLFSDPWAALDVMACALAPGGRLAILTTIRPAGRPGALVTDVVGRAGGVRLFGRDEVTDHLTDRGLRIIDQRTFGVMQLVGAWRPPTRHRNTPRTSAPSSSG